MRRRQQDSLSYFSLAAPTIVAAAAATGGGGGSPATASTAPVEAAPPTTAAARTADGQGGGGGKGPSSAAPPASRLAALVPRKRCHSGRGSGSLGSFEADTAAALAPVGAAAGVGGCDGSYSGTPVRLQRWQEQQQQLQAGGPHDADGVARPAKRSNSAGSGGGLHTAFPAPSAPSGSSGGTAVALAMVTTTPAHQGAPLAAAVSSGSSQQPLRGRPSDRLLPLSSRSHQTPEQFEEQRVAPFNPRAANVTISRFEMASLFAGETPMQYPCPIRLKIELDGVVQRRVYHCMLRQWLAGGGSSTMRVGVACFPKSSLQGLLLRGWRREVLGPAAAAAAVADGSSSIILVLRTSTHQDTRLRPLVVPAIPALGAAAASGAAAGPAAAGLQQHTATGIATAVEGALLLPQVQQQGEGIGPDDVEIAPAPAAAPAAARAPALPPKLQRRWRDDMPSARQQFSGGNADTEMADARSDGAPALPHQAAGWDEIQTRWSDGGSASHHGSDAQLQQQQRGALGMALSPWQTVQQHHRQDTAGLLSRSAGVGGGRARSPCSTDQPLDSGYITQSGHHFDRGYSRPPRDAGHSVGCEQPSRRSGEPEGCSEARRVGTVSAAVEQAVAMYCRGLSHAQQRHRDGMQLEQLSQLCGRLKMLPAAAAAAALGQGHRVGMEQQAIGTEARPSGRSCGAAALPAVDHSTMMDHSMAMSDNSMMCTRQDSGGMGSWPAAGVAAAAGRYSAGALSSGAVAAPGTFHNSQSDAATSQQQQQQCHEERGNNSAQHQLLLARLAVALAAGAGGAATAVLPAADGGVVLGRSSHSMSHGRAAAAAGTRTGTGTVVMDTQHQELAPSTLLRQLGTVLRHVVSSQQQQHHQHEAQQQQQQQQLQEQCAPTSLSWPDRHRSPPSAYCSALQHATVPVDAAAPAAPSSDQHPHPHPHGAMVLMPDGSLQPLSSLLQLAAAASSSHASAGQAPNAPTTAASPHHYHSASQAAQQQQQQQRQQHRAAAVSAAGPQTTLAQPGRMGGPVLQAHEGPATATTLSPAPSLPSSPSPCASSPASSIHRGAFDTCDAAAPAASRSCSHSHGHGTSAGNCATTAGRTQHPQQQRQAAAEPAPARSANSAAPPSPKQEQQPAPPSPSAPAAAASTPVTAPVPTLPRLRDGADNQTAIRGVAMAMRRLVLPPGQWRTVYSALRSLGPQQEADFLAHDYGWLAEAYDTGDDMGLRFALEAIFKVDTSSAEGGAAAAAAAAVAGEL